MRSWRVSYLVRSQMCWISGSIASLMPSVRNTYRCTSKRTGQLAQVCSKHIQLPTFRQQINITEPSKKPRMASGSYIAQHILVMDHAMRPQSCSD